MPSSLEIAGRIIGPGQPVYIVAELSANHRGSFERAAAIVKAAAEAGADAVKLQTYTPDTMTIDCDNEYFRIKGASPWAGKNLYALYREACTPWEWHPKLKELAEERGITLFSTPFDATAVDFLEEMGVSAYKIASFELTDVHLLRYVAATGKPVIVSTGMASEEEVQETVDTLRAADAGPISLLKCTSAYPAPPEEMNLRALAYLAERFDVVTGLSDHTLDETIPVAATALGARIIEKHLTLSRADGGPDASFSLEPDEFTRVVRAVRATDSALGEARLQCSAGEADHRLLRRSLFVVQDIRVGERFTAENVRCIRPGHGLAPRNYEAVLGKRAARDIPRGTPLCWELIVQ